MKKIINNIKHLTIITLSYIITANYASTSSIQTQPMYGVDPPTTPITIAMSIWDKILHILLSPIALIIYLIIIIIGIIVFVKKRKKNKKINIEKNVKKSS